MSRTPSNMIALGTKAPEFKLLDTVSEKMLSFNDVKGSKGTFIMFICNHCPFVQHLHFGIQSVYEEYQDSGIGFVAISSNDVENYPDDSPEKMKSLFKRLSLDFPYLYDEDQSVAKAYEAACTPDFYLFDENDELVYRGQFDDSRPNNGMPVKGDSIREALEALLNGSGIVENQRPSLGCNIKWKEATYSK